MKKKVWMWIALVAVVVIIVALVAVKEKSSPVKDSILKIGCISILSGDVATYGKETKQGIDLAVEEAARIAAVSAEQSSRIAADGVLQSNIDAEETARIAKDSELQSNIGDEVSDRKAADASIVTKKRCRRTSWLVLMEP